MLVYRSEVSVYLVTRIMNIIQVTSAPYACICNAHSLLAIGLPRNTLSEHYPGF